MNIIKRQLNKKNEAPSTVTVRVSSHDESWYHSLQPLSLTSPLPKDDLFRDPTFL